MPPKPHTVLAYRDPAGAEPFTRWLHSLRDARTRRHIIQRIFRLESGNFGDCKPVGGGVSELRIFIGPGYRSLDEISVEYFERNPEEIEDFLDEIFAEYARDGDSAALLSTLRVVARVKGLSAIAEEIGMTRQGLQKALSAKGNPRLDNINAIMRAMGYQLVPRPIDQPVG
jgi:putative addiction module killer protein